MVSMRRCLNPCPPLLWLQGFLGYLPQEGKSRNPIPTTLSFLAKGLSSSLARSHNGNDLDVLNFKLSRF
jgi:hypothetical protein